jgi:hypothetical protein
MTDRATPELRDHSGRHSPVVRRYELYVEGRLGSALLGYLCWSNRTQPEHSIVRVRSTYGELHQLLASCSDSGLTIERVTRIDSIFPEATVNHG